MHVVTKALSFSFFFPWTDNIKIQALQIIHGHFIHVTRKEKERRGWHVQIGPMPILKDRFCSKGR